MDQKSVKTGPEAVANFAYQSLLQFTTISNNNYLYFFIKKLFWAFRAATDKNWYVKYKVYKSTITTYKSIALIEIQSKFENVNETAEIESWDAHRIQHWI